MMTVKKKKTPFIVEEEKPAPSMTRGSVTVEGKAPVQRIDLTNDQGFKNYAKSANERADVESYKKSTPRFDKNALVLPDGRRLTGTFDELNTWKNAYLNLKGIKNPEIEQTQRAEIQAGLDKDALKQQMIQAQTPQLTPEEIAQVGSLDPETLANDPLSENIQRNIRERESLGTIYDADGNLRTIPILPGRQINKVSGAIPSGNIKNTIINLLSNSEAGRAYLSDYSNEDNFDKIKQNIDLSDDKISVAKDLASKGFSNEAQKLYSEALAQKEKSRRQLKLIAENDQRAYTQKVRLEMTELEVYFQDFKSNDDLEFINALTIGRQT